MLNEAVINTEVAADSVSDILKTIFIPPCPVVVAALLKEARCADVDFNKIIRLISGDLSLAASMMKTANSPIFALRNKVETVQKAAAVLGLKNILCIVNGLALKRSLSSNGVSMERFWERSNYHATVSTRLARRVPGISQEDAYTFGLFHDCGIPILMQRFPDYKETLLIANRSAKAVWETETERHGTDHVTVGAMLAHNWHLPELIVKAIRMHHNFEILSDSASTVSDEVRALTAISLLADHLIARFLDVPDETEWMAHGTAALNYLNFDEEELAELQCDVEEDLNTIRLDRS
ncbi:HDOD domain-containing protein [Quatrionicoccus australiensis]|uniref:HDOD domain-containing protein n=1 Tax=Quatrionicoccus australiensis TaxID=138118 RepID=UPI001CF877FC|nr:HDOD domain-containing protein [Quatrionicoccus australiensis]UCV15377.1 HDOD domain-containing protein [Quatrionicoccus australiensis]